MKKVFNTSLAVFFSTQAAFAWSFNIGGTKISGDDPQIIKDAGKAIDHAANQVANVVRDTFAVVGNATGLTDAVESNVETFTNIGRVYACMETFCYSEILRKKQLEEAEAEAKREYDQFVAEKVKEYEISSKKERKESAKTAWKMAQSRYEIVEEAYKLLQMEEAILRGLMTGISQETEFRKKLLENNVIGRPLKNREMIETSEGFAKSFKQDYEGALKKLNENIQTLSKTTKRSHSQLMAEFLRIVEVDVLTVMAEKTSQQLTTLQSEAAKLKNSALEASVNAQSARQAYELEQ